MLAQRSLIKSYPITTWNIHSILEKENSDDILINRTNNPLERYNRRYNDLFPNTSQPHMIQWITKIKEDANEIVQQLKLIQSGRYGKQRAHQPPTIYPIPDDYHSFIPVVPTLRKYCR